MQIQNYIFFIFALVVSLFFLYGIMGIISENIKRNKGTEDSGKENGEIVEEATVIIERYEKEHEQEQGIEPTEEENKFLVEKVIELLKQRKTKRIKFLNEDSLNVNEELLGAKKEASKKDDDTSKSPPLQTAF